MPKKLAIVISGAVSLGSYEAGVMYELLEALAIHNEMLEDTHPDRVIIDVITGASAGAMTAAILSQQIYFGGHRLRKAYSNPLFDAWVTRVEIDDLLKVDSANHKYSLLSSAVVDDIGKEFIPDVPAGEMDPHPAASDTLQLGLAMSNLNGFSQEIPGQKDSFAYSSYKDQFVCRLQTVSARSVNPLSIDKDNGPTVKLNEMEPRRRKGRQDVWRPMATTSTWSVLRMMALSSGAFPFAFRARRIVRTGGSPANLMLTRDSSRKAGAGDRLYGGNYLYTDGGVFENEPVGMAASLAREIDDKDQNARRSYLFVAPGKREIDADPFFNRDDDLLAMATGLASAVFGQSRYQQWVTEGLEGKLFTVTASDALLIGDVFSAFAGFLEYEFRAYDYNIGRRQARQHLRDGSFSDLIGDFNLIDAKMPMIDWPKEVEEKANVSVPYPQPDTNPYVNERIADGYDEYETEAWKRVRNGLIGLAKPYITVDNDGVPKRDQLIELRRLMVRVKPERRTLIAEQILARVDSLVDFFNEAYLDKLDSRRRSRLFRWVLRQIVGKPLTKVLLRRLIQPVLDVNVLHPIHEAL